MANSNDDAATKAAAEKAAAEKAAAEKAAAEKAAAEKAKGNSIAPVYALHSITYGVDKSGRGLGKTAVPGDIIVPSNAKEAAELADLGATRPLTKAEAALHREVSSEADVIG